MTKDDIIKRINVPNPVIVFLQTSLPRHAERFAALVAAAERERACRIVTGLCISDNNAHEINTKIREGNP